MSLNYIDYLFFIAIGSAVLVIINSILN